MIRLYRNQLFYDIEQQTHRIAEVRISAESPELRHRAQVRTEPEQSDEDLLIRWIESGVSDLHIWMRNKLVKPGENEGWWTGWGEYNSNEPTESLDDGDITVAHSDDPDPEPVADPVHDDALNRSIMHYDFEFGCNVDEKAMAMLFHRFIVRYCLWQWATMFGFTDVASDCKAQCKDLKADIDDNMNDVALPKKWHDPHTPHLQIEHTHERFEVF